jgi:hypothetical protein
MACSSLISFSWISSLSLIRRTACACAQFRGCSSTTNTHSETGQTVVCCQNLTLCARPVAAELCAGWRAIWKIRSLFESTSWMWVVSLTRRTSELRRKRPWYYRVCNRLSPRCWSGRFGREKTPLRLQGIKPRFFRSPGVSLVTRSSGLSRTLTTAIVLEFKLDQENTNAKRQVTVTSKFCKMASF